MKKKIALGLIAAVVVVGGVASMSAWEAHIINVTAKIENALSVSTDELEFGTVFPQEYLERQFTIELSSSFVEEGRVDDVEYVIKQKPKCVCVDTQFCEEGTHAQVDYATHECPEGYGVMLSLCPFLSKMDADPEDVNDTSYPSYYNDNDTPADPSDDTCIAIERIYNELAFSPYGWAGWSCPAGSVVVGGGVNEGATVEYSGPAKEGEPNYPVYPHYTYTPPEEGWVVQNDNDNETIKYYVDCIASRPDATGMLTKIGGDRLDSWTVDLKVPPVEGSVGQDWPASCANWTVPADSQNYGCDLWIEVTGISPTEPVCGDGWITPPEQCETDADCEVVCDRLGLEVGFCRPPGPMGCGCVCEGLMGP